MVGRYERVLHSIAAHRQPMVVDRHARILIDAWTRVAPAW